MAADNMSLGNFRLEGIPPAPRGVPQVDVTFDIDANGILNVTAQDKATGKAQKIVITASTNLNNNEVERLVKDAEQHRAADERRHHLAQARNEADTLLYQSEKALRDLGDRVPASDRTAIEQQIQTLQDVVQREDVDAIRNASDALRNATYALTQQMNAAPTDGGGQWSGYGPHTEQPEGQKDGDDVVEGQYTEI
jgi:molecular chaperone DnaK